ncbi:MAG: DUF503 domain-containing protein [Dehalococcoidales bacterium]|nr:DUF503 domain-containing protein [Dehalococcoidales bacterium]
MHVGICRVEVRLPENSSLKDKRRVLKPIISRLANKFNISVAEIDNHDLWQRATIGIACVSNDKRHANEILSKAVNYIIEGRLEVEVLDYKIEILPVFDM